MKKSDLKLLIREVIMETMDNDPMAQKFFIAIHNHVKNNGKKATRQSVTGDAWFMNDVKVLYLNRDKSRWVVSQSVIVMMDSNGTMVWKKGSLPDLKDLLVSISENRIKKS